MPQRNKKRLGPGWVTLFVVAGLIELTLVLKWLLIGKNVSLFNPQGYVSHEQHNLFLLLVVLLVFAAVPVVLFLYFVAWKYRESNTKAVHTPKEHKSKLLVFSIWAYPLIFFVIFTAILIPATHRLEAKDTIASDKEPLKIQVIALRWKWLFLYPEQNVASVNFVQLPVDRPVSFDLTADDAPMSSFWIPNVGGQLYAMTGHVNRLNLMADHIGVYRGSSAEINGHGFADMTFQANVGAESDFDMWVRNLQQGTTKLDTAAYEELIRPSQTVQPAYYNGYDSDLYATVVSKYMSHAHGSEGGNTEESKEGTN
jgi:cytochrome o ubiquinol oxidase subunit 2